MSETDAPELMRRDEAVLQHRDAAAITARAAAMACRQVAGLLEDLANTAEVDVGDDCSHEFKAIGVPYTAMGALLSAFMRLNPVSTIPSGDERSDD